MSKSVRPGTIAFLIVLFVTTMVWIFRGFGVLSFMPGSFLWILIGLCILAAVLSTLR